MLAKDLEQLMRRIGLVFILGLVLQLRINGRAVLLPFFAGAMVWLLAKLAPIARSPEAQRALRGAIVCAALVTAAAVIGLLPGMEPGAVSVVVVVLFLTGVAAYAWLLTLWSRAAEWADAERYLHRAWTWLLVDVGATVIAVAALLALGTPGHDGIDGADETNIVLGQHVRGPAAFAVIVVISAIWIFGAVALQMASKRIRTELREQPDSLVPKA